MADNDDNQFSSDVGPFHGFSSQGCPNLQIMIEHCSKGRGVKPMFRKYRFRKVILTYNLHKIGIEFI